MATGPVTLFSRLALIICGTISILLFRTFRMIQGAMFDAKVRWSLFSVPLILIGGLTLLIALLPSSWSVWVWSSKTGTQNSSSVPMKLLGGFAAFSYLFTVGLKFAPLSWHPTAKMVYLACPACVLTITVDPSLGAVLLVLAPLNAAVYGSLGAVLGYMFLAVRNRI